MFLNTVLFLFLKLFIYLFIFCRAARLAGVPQPRIEPGPRQVKAWNTNH